MHDYSLQEIYAYEIAALDLKTELTRLTSRKSDPALVETYRLWLPDTSEPPDVLWIPSLHRGAIASGAPATWTDASDVDDLVRRWLEDDLIP